MTTRLKTIEYWFPYKATLADNVATALTQITVYIPEAASGSITFRSVVIDVQLDDQTATPANTSSRIIDIALEGEVSSTGSTVSNAQTLTQGGENYFHQFSGTFTSYFTNNWGSNGSRTLDCSITVNTGTSGSANASVRVIITYAFDDTQSTHVKTVWIPLNAPTGAMGTTKSTIYDTIPALDTYCPEASKTFRQTTLVIQGNTESNSATSINLSFQIDETGSTLTSTNYVKTSTTDKWYRLNEVISITTSATHDLYMWASTADFDHPQVWLVVTYEFSPGSTTTILNSLWLPMEFGGPMGGPTSSDFQRAERELWIEEPATITTQRVACLFFYDKLAAQTGLNARVGTGSFVSYTDVGTVVAGGAGLMVRNDSAFTLARGRNILQADIYNTDTTDLGYNLASVWLVNYTSGVPTNGIWAANHTVIRNLKAVDTQAATVQSIVSAVAPDLPETTNFRTSIGLHYVYTSNSTGTPMGVHIGTERSSGEGGPIWENIYEAFGGSDPETGVRQAWATARSVFKRWVDGSVEDAGVDRLSLETARRWRLALGGSCASFDHLDMYITYHTITFTVSGNVTGSGGGTVNLSLCRATTGEVVMKKTRTGDGSYSFTWFDNTEYMYVDAYEDETHLGRSATGLATGSA
jgi:hypothetical protein